VDRLACPLHALWLATVRPRDSASYQALSYPIAAVGGGVFLEDVNPLGLDIWWSVDHPSTCSHILSCQAINIATSQGPDSDGAYSVLQALGRGSRVPGCALS
jgi:hypothetical protein